MKITINQLRRIIKEEVKRNLNEAEDFDPSSTGLQNDVYETLAAVPKALQDAVKVMNAKLGVDDGFLKEAEDIFQKTVLNGLRHGVNSEFKEVVLNQAVNDYMSAVMTAQGI